MVQGLVIFNHPAYVPQRWHATLMMIAISGLSVLGCTIGKALLPLWESLAGSLHVSALSVPGELTLADGTYVVSSFSLP